LENCDEGDMFDLVEKNARLDEQTAKIYFHQIALAVQAIHSSGVSHRDLSLENVFLKRIAPCEMVRNGGLKQIVKLGDFGIAHAMSSDCQFSGDIDNRPGKTSYMAPELYEGKSYDGRLIDIWSLGVILIILLCRGSLWQRPHSSSDSAFRYMMRKGVKALLDWHKVKVSDLGIDLLGLMLCPAERRTQIDGILSHPWLSTSPLSRDL